MADLHGRGNFKDARIAERVARVIARAGSETCGDAEYSFSKAPLTERLRSLRVFLTAFLSIGIEWSEFCD